MANTRISDLTASASNLASTDLAPVVQTAGVGPVKMTGLQLAAGLLSATMPIGSDPILTRAAAATLQLGAADAAAPVAQTFKVQSGTAGASATTVSISGTSLTIAGTVTGTIAIGHAVTGTGVSAGTLITAGSGTSWTVNNSQTVGPITAYFNSVGADFTIRGSQGSGPSAGGSLIFQVAPAGSAATTAQNAYSTALTINSAQQLVLGSAGSASAPAINGGTTITNGATSGIYWSGNGQMNFSSYTGGVMRIGGAATVQLTDTAEFGWGALTGSNDLKLFRDAANTLALRNGTNAQKFRVYNTYTSSTNYENFEIDWQTTANIALVGPTKGSGGGTQRVQRLQYLEDGGTGSTTPSLGTTCPAASATIKSWIKVITSDGTTAYIPCWA